MMMWFFAGARLSLPFASMAIGILFVATNCAQAASVIFQFDAKVIDVDVLFPSTLPFSPALGDIIRGKVSFEPVDASSNTSETNTVQDLGVAFEFETMTLETTSYQLRVRNDSPLIDAPELSSDDIWLGCTSVGSAACHPNMVPGTTDYIWWFSLPLLGAGSVLDGADIPEDPDVWGQLTPAYLTITIQKANVADVLRINAKIEGFVEVPEPSALFSLVWLSIGLQIVSLRQYRRRK